jgi:hypothetical protein
MRAICHVELSTNTTCVGLGTKSRDAAHTVPYYYEIRQLILFV